jgi:hypothetical protein
MKHNAVKQSTSYLLPFIPNVIGHEACRFIGKIHMHLTASGALVAMRHRAMKWTTKLKKLSVVADV